jgi:flagellar biosynthetic protein FliR
MRLPLLLPSFAMVAARIFGIVVAAPVMGSPMIPRRIKVLFVVAMSASVFPLVEASLPMGLSLGSAVGGLAGELMIGVTIGVGFRLVFSGAAIAARLVGQQAGLASAQLFDPVFEASSTAIGELYFFFTILVFFTIGGHHALILCVLDTFRSTPVMTFAVTPSIVDMLNNLITAAFAFGLRLAAPVLIAIFLASMTLQFISRTLPQLNILSVGFAIRTLIGIWIITAGIGAVNQVFSNSFWEFADAVRDALM